VTLAGDLVPDKSPFVQRAFVVRALVPDRVHLPVDARGEYLILAGHDEPRLALFEISVTTNLLP
jgi:hypothetical protein